MIDLRKYQRFASQGIQPATLEREPVVGFALGLAGEAGEVVDDIKKKYFHGRHIDDAHTKEELGDVLWYVANICNCYGFDMEQVIFDNQQKLIKRYPDLYADKNNCLIKQEFNLGDNKNED